jgi:hypothetical protein
MKVKRKEKSTVKEVRYVGRVSRRGNHTFGMRELVEVEVPTPVSTPRKKRQSSSGQEVPKKRIRTDEAGAQANQGHSSYTTKVRYLNILTLNSDLNGLIRPRTII